MTKALSPTQAAFLAACKAHNGLFWNGHENGWVGRDPRELTEAEANILHPLTGSVTARTPRSLEKLGLVYGIAYHGTTLWEAV